MKEVIADLIASAINLEASAKKHRADRRHIAATRAEKLARNYRSAAKLVNLVYPRKN